METYTQMKLQEHLKNLVSCYPATNDQQAVRNLLEYCLLHLNSASMDDHAKIHTVNGVHSLYVSTTGEKRTKILLQGHVDVVSASRDLQEISTNVPGKIIGRGVYDMLYATACYLTLLEDISAQLKTLDIGILLTGDEEYGGFNGASYFVKDGYGADVVFLPDAGEGLGQLNTGSKGVYSFDLIIHGQAHHGSRPWEGDGAGNKLIAALSDLISSTDNSKASPFTIVVTHLSGGDSMNKGPADTGAHIDVRYTNSVALSEFMKKLKFILTRYDGKVGNLMEASAFTLDMDNTYVKDFVKLYAKYAPDAKIKMGRTDGSSDARFFAVEGIPVIMLRPKGGNAHGGGEWIDVGELSRFYELLKRYVLNVAKM